jgi:hypothetical protein
MQIEATSSSKMLVPIYQTAQCHVCEDCNLNIRIVQMKPILGTANKYSHWQVIV